MTTRGVIAIQTAAAIPAPRMRNRRASVQYRKTLRYPCKTLSPIVLFVVARLRFVRCVKFGSEESSFRMAYSVILNPEGS